MVNQLSEYIISGGTNGELNPILVDNLNVTNYIGYIPPSTGGFGSVLLSIFVQIVPLVLFLLLMV